MKIRNVLMSLLAIALIWACGKDDDPAPPKNTAPVIAAKTFTVAENIAPNTAIGTVTATDADKDALTFSIKTNDNNLFVITGAGVVILASDKTLSFATKAQHVITVAVTDGEASASAKVTINVTEVDLANNAPVIAAQQFTVSESIDDTFEIGAVQATDPEQDDLTFSIVTNDNDLFEITEAGSLSLAPGQSLDFAIAQEHTITVAVSDGNSSVNAEITIKVTQGDPNNQSPVIEPHEFSVVESIDDLYEIGIVEATDPEQDDMTFSISVNDNDLFEISVDGELSLAQGMQLNYDAQQQHIIKVTVSDGTNMVETTVTINVEEALSLADDPTSFVTTWKTETDGESITIGLVNYFYDFTIDWGDGTIETLTTQNPDNLVHEYSTAGTYKVAINGTFKGINMGTTGTTNAKKLISLDQWGDLVWGISMNNAFGNCENMIYSAQDIPNLSVVETTNNMFKNCKNFNGDIGNWNVSNITDMKYMFSGASSFNQDLNGWDTAQVTEMTGMFYNATSFNGNISNWTVTNVVDMGLMFYGASSFNQDISNWVVDNVTDMNDMFREAAAFNQNISGWVVTNVTDVSGMFRDATSFNQDISNWVVDNVTDMNDMFRNATSFNQDIGLWNVGNVTKMASMFNGASSFNQDLPFWDISSGVSMLLMLNNCGMSSDNYGKTLVGWADNPNFTASGNIGVSGLEYCLNSVDELARSFLIDNKNMFFDGDIGIQCN